LDAFNDFLKVFFAAMLPVTELRGAIPLGVTLGLSPAENYIAAVAGNLLPVPFVVIFIRRVFGWLQTKSNFLNKIVDKLTNSALKKSNKLRPGSFLIALIIFVAIPLPGTGAWTGAIISAFLNIRLKTALPAIFTGVIIAGIVVSLLSYGVKFAFA
jgi:uncharacterized membrane protein